MKKISVAAMQLSKGMDVIGGVVLVLMMLVTVCDVVLRYVGHPVFGSYDMITFGAVIVVGCAMPRTSIERTHTFVDILIEKISPAKGNGLLVFTRILNVLLFLFLAWSLFDVARTAVKTGETSLLLSIPLYIPPGVLTICCLAECLVHASKVMEIVSSGGRR
jgi:TRAP-type C4-dicarboxylate transport system permease small subunit